MLAPGRVAVRRVEQVQRRQRWWDLIPARGVIGHVLVEVAPLLTRQLHAHQPVPSELACTRVRLRVTEPELDQLVEEANGGDDGAAEARPVEDATRARVDAERPRRVRRIAGTDVSRERVGGAQRGAEVAPVTGLFVEEEIAAPEQADLVGLDTSVEATG